MEQGDVLDTEEAVAAEFAFGGPAASYRNQWLCVKAAFTQKDGIVFLGTALGAKSVAANVIKEWFPGRRTPKSTTLVSDGLLVGGVLVFKARRDECYGRGAKQYLAFGKRPTRIVQTEMEERIRGTYVPDPEGIIDDTASSSSSSSPSGLAGTVSLTRI